MEQRQVLTLRVPVDLLAEIRQWKTPGESLNDFVVKTIESEVRRRRGLAAMEDIERLREQIRQRTGTHPDTTPWIRAMREGNSRDD